MLVIRGVGRSLKLDARQAPSNAAGYAALVAELSERLLAERRFCFLFTDLANPTSNKIYQAIGYEPVIDIDQWSFEPT